MNGWDEKQIGAIQLKHEYPVRQSEGVLQGRKQYGVVKPNHMHKAEPVPQSDCVLPQGAEQ